MSHHIPHPTHAEDQPYAHTLLITHVLTRGFQTGAILGSLTSLTRTLLTKNALTSTFLATTGYGAAIGTAIMVPGLAMRMSGREEIEWKDRSWRLLENQGQMEVDEWSSLGALGGAAVAVRREVAARVKAGRWVRVVGSVALGDLVGVGGYLVWRYGVHWGRWPGREV